MTHEPPAGRLPDFVIIGAMKSGTSSLHTSLRRHPDVFAPDSETHFFCCQRDRGVDWYRSLFAGAGEKLAGEKTPHYLGVPHAIDQLAETVPDAKLIVLLRDPVDRAVSHYWHMRRAKREALPLTEALAAEASRLQRGDNGFGYVAYGRYLGHLEHVARRFSRDSMFVVLFEDLRDRPIDTFQATCRFLGVDETVVPPVVGNAVNSYREERAQWLWNRMFRHRLWRFLPKRTATALALWMRGEPVEYPPLAPDLRKSLAEGFAADNAALATWLGRDLSLWTAPR